MKEEKITNENNQDEKNKKIEKKKKGKKKKKRCYLNDCNKKLKLTNLECKCKHRFCSKHRLPESHDCQWDPKSNDEFNKFKKNCCLNVTAHFSKIDKI